MPVAGAEVAILDDEHAPELIRTEPDGVCAVRSVPGGRAAIAVRHAGFATFTGELASLPTRDGKLEVTLLPGGSIAGRVRTRSGGLPPGPVRVVAWRAAGPKFRSEDSRRAANSDPRVLAADVDDLGDFQLVGLAPGTEYTILAAGPGLIQVDAAPVCVVPDRAPVVVTVAPLFAMDVRLVDDASGELIRASPRVKGCGSSYLGREGVIAEFPVSFSPLRLAGVHTPQPGDPHSGQRFFMAIASEHDSDAFGPFRFRAAAPGYTAVETQIWAKRVRPGAELAQEVRLVRECAGFGSIRLSLSERSRSHVSELLSATGATLLSSVEFSAMERDARRSMRFSLASVHRHDLDIDDIPIGSYSGRVILPVGAKSIRSRRYPLDVAAGARCDVELDLAGLTALEVLPVLDSGAAYSGRLHVVLRVGASDAGGSWGFPGPPYVLFGVEPGHYDAYLLGQSLSSDVDVPVSVADGGATRVEIALKAQ